MEDLLSNPAVQAGVLPFAVALVLAVILRNTRYLGLAIAAGFLCAVAVTIGFRFETLTSVRKLVLVAVAAMAIDALLQATRQQPKVAIRAAVAAAVALGALWMLQRILLQRDAMALVVAGGGAAMYCIALLAGGQRAGRDPVAAGAVALVIGLASGALAVLGASAQLAQFGIALGAGAGAVLLVQVFTGARAPAGWTLGFAAQVIAALLGLLAVFTGSLPWYCLLPIPLIAWSASLAPGRGRPVWQRAALSVVFALVPAACAVALAWFAGGSTAT